MVQVLTISLVRAGQCAHSSRRARRSPAIALSHSSGGGDGHGVPGRDLRLGRRVALKLIAPELAENEHLPPALHPRVPVAAAIDHPNIVPIYRGGRDRRRALHRDAVRLRSRSQVICWTATARCPWRSPRESSVRWRPRWTPPTTAVWSTGTSSRATSWSPRAPTATGARLPHRLRPDEEVAVAHRIHDGRSVRRHARLCGARADLRQPGRRPGPTSTPSGACCTSASPGPSRTAGRRAAPCSGPIWSRAPPSVTSERPGPPDGVDDGGRDRDGQGARGPVRHLP